MLRLWLCLLFTGLWVVPLRAQIDSESVPVVLVSPPAFPAESQPDGSSPDPRTVEVELWIGSNPVTASPNLGVMDLPPVVSDLPGRLVFRDRWGLPLPAPTGSRLRNLVARDSDHPSRLRLHSRSTTNGVGVSVANGWRNSRVRLQTSGDLVEWHDAVNESEAVAPDQPRRFFRASIAAPEPPVWIATRSGEERVKLTWAGSGESFRIEWSADRANLEASLATNSQTELTSPAAVRGLPSGTSCFFRIQSFGPAGKSSWSAVTTVTTSAQSAPSPRRRLLIYGSSVAAGAGDVTGKGWAGRLADHIGADWLVVNRSVPGDTTGALLARFDRDVAGEKWDVVWVALSLMNEGILGPAPASIYDGYVRNQRRLIDLIRQLGAVPVVSGTYPSAHYGSREYAWCRQFNNQLNRWAVAGVDFMAALDDGDGRWLPGFSWDALHPNAAGHEAMFRSIPGGFLDSLLAAHSAPGDDGQAITLGNDTTTANPASFLPGKPLSDFSVSFWFKGTNISDKSLCGVGPGASRIRAPGGSLRYTSDSGAEILVNNATPGDGRWHHVSITHHSGAQRTRLYLDGILIGSIPETFPAIERFTLGGRADNAAWANAVGVSFRGFTIHRVPLSAEIVAGMAAGRTWKLSADLLLPVSQWLSSGSPAAPGPPELRGTLQLNSPAWLPEAPQPSLDP